MRVRVARVALSPHHGYVCLSCRMQVTRVGKQRRYQHEGPSATSEAGIKAAGHDEGVQGEKGSAPGSSLKIRDIIRGFMFNNTVRAAKGDNAAQSEAPSPKIDTEQNAPKQPLRPSDDAEAKQQILQQKFASQRRKQMLKIQGKETPSTVTDPNTPSEPTHVRKIVEEQDRKAKAREKRPNRATRRAQIKLRREAEKTSKRVDRKAQELERSVQKSLLTHDLLTPFPSNEKLRANANSGKEKAKIKASDVHDNQNDSPKDPDVHLPKVTHRDPTSTAGEAQKDGSSSKPTKVETKVETKVKGNEESPKDNKEAEHHYNSKSEGDKLSEMERKDNLAKKLTPLVKAHIKKVRSSTSKSGESGFTITKTTSTRVDNVAGFKSLKSALGKEAIRQQAVIETADATKLNILPITVDQSPVPGLAYGLERVLFNPGVYQLQDPRSRVYNFDPYLQKIMPVAEFDFNALKEYITSSKDESLKRIAQEYRKRYVGSTSSMTGILAHFHFLLSQWRPIKTSMMSKNFPARLESFTELQRTPSAIFLRWKDGSYAIDADKQFANANVLSMLGKSMEKLLTLDRSDYEKYRKTSGGEVSEEEQSAPESYHYSTMGDFLMRSQLDAHDPRLPGTGMFDLKTRAVVSIRMDVANYEHGLGYQIRSRQGAWESYEREYYDMIRAAFLKYSMQVRMGRMDGIFVTFHNIERIFGFQYISLPEMDLTIHGQWDTSLGDQEFKLSLDLLNKILDRATKRFPETSLRIHFETREAATPFMYIFAEPVTEEQVAETQGQNDAKVNEFERNILGLNRVKESEDQEDDGQWENIQASVQEAMDKDELSVDKPSQSEESCQEDFDGHESSTEHQSLLEHGPLYAKRNRLKASSEPNAAIGSNNMNDAEEKDDDKENEESSDREDEDSEEDGRKESEDDQGVSEPEECGREASEEAVEKDRAVFEDPTDKELEPCKAVSDDSDSSGVPEPHGSPIPDGKPGTAPGDSSGDNTSSLTQNETPESAAKASYTPPVPGDEAAESDYQIEADSPFLDSVAEEREDTNSTLPSDILAMTLTLRNKVNNQFVHRPENMTSKDVWSIEYSLLEVPTQQKAKALYEACKVRRQKKMDAPEIPEEEEVISQYLANLRKMSAKGKAWRKEMDEADKQKPIQVLGSPPVVTKGEGSLLDQDPEA